MLHDRAWHKEEISIWKINVRWAESFTSQAVEQFQCSCLMRFEVDLDFACFRVILEANDNFRQDYQFEERAKNANKLLLNL